MSKRLCLIPILSMSLATEIFPQALFSPRAVGLAAYGASVKDSRGFGSNPAGLVDIRDWEFTISTYSSLAGDRFVFHGLAFGKRFLEDEAVAFQYSPGSLLEFVVPSSITFIGPGVPANVDRKISYEELFSFGYAHRFSPGFAVGIGGRARGEKVTDTQYQLVSQDTITIAVPVQHTEERNSVNLNLGLSWRAHESVSLSATVRNVLSIRPGRFSDEFAHFHLPRKARLELGVSYNVTHAIRAAVEGGSAGTGALGFEFTPGFGLALRSGLYANKSESPFVYGVAAGLGWSYEFLDVDFSYLRFFNQGTRTGSASLADFDAAKILDIDLNSYTRDRITLSVKAIFGNIRESLVKIESVEMFGAVYPSAFEVLAFRPIGKVRIKNVSTKPVQAKASFFVDHYMDSPTQTPPVYMLPGEEHEVSITAVFNEKVKTTTTLIVRDATVAVASSMDQDDDKVQTKMLIRGRNDWDGDVHTLRYFVSPDAPEVIRFTRDVLVQSQDSLSGIPSGLQAFQKAKVLINAFVGKLMYLNDPKQSSDHVQYPAETLQLRGGDCDDMTVLFSSLLSSIGISTAFVDVVPPQQPGLAHIYMLFDTGLDPKFGGSISSNPKRYAVRKNAAGKETLWIPLETTAVNRGFEAAWKLGAEEFFKDVELDLGLAKDWVRIVDVY